MADVSKIQLPGGTTLDIKDKTSGYIKNSDLPSYTLSIAGPVITLTGSDSSVTSITLPVYDGSVT